MRHIKRIGEEKKTLSPIIVQHSDGISQRYDAIRKSATVRRLTAHVSTKHAVVTTDAHTSAPGNGRGRKSQMNIVAVCVKIAATMLRALRSSVALHFFRAALLVAMLGLAAHIVHDMIAFDCRKRSDSAISFYEH